MLTLAAIRYTVFMQQHAVPRQITTFEFKLIGFMSIKQFGYLVIVTGFTVLAYFAVPIKYLNFVSGGIVAALGGMFTFFKYNERSIDVWIKNFYFATTKPSKFFYFKNNPIPDFLRDVYITQDSSITENHLDATKKLSNYMSTTGQAIVPDVNSQHITRLIIETEASDHKKKVVGVAHNVQQVTASLAAMGGKKLPILSGVIKNTKDEPLQNIMLYLNSETGQTIRILKTNHNGVFATFQALPPGKYSISPKDLNAMYFFDTMNITVDESQQKPVTIYSKEIL